VLQNVSPLNITALVFIGPCLVPSFWASLGFRFTFFSVRGAVKQTAEIKWEVRALCVMTPCILTHSLRGISSLFSNNPSEDVGGEMSLRNVGTYIPDCTEAGRHGVVGHFRGTPSDLAQLPLIYSTQYLVFHNQIERNAHPADLLMYYERRPKCWGGYLSQCYILHLEFMVD
jgi:hypothetical protein